MPVETAEMTARELEGWVGAVDARLRGAALMVEPGRRPHGRALEGVWAAEALEALVETMRRAGAEPGAVAAAARTMLDERGMERHVVAAEKSLRRIRDGYA